MDKEVEIISIDGKEYYVLKKITYNDTTFYYLSNTIDENDTLIRKQDIEDQSSVIPLEDDKEFELACNLILKDILI